MRNQAVVLTTLSALKPEHEQSASPGDPNNYEFLFRVVRATFQDLDDSGSDTLRLPDRIPLKIKVGEWVNLSDLSRCAKWSDDEHREWAERLKPLIRPLVDPGNTTPEVERVQREIELTYRANMEKYARMAEVPLQARNKYETGNSPAHEVAQSSSNETKADSDSSSHGYLSDGDAPALRSINSAATILSQPTCATDLDATGRDVSLDEAQQITDLARRKKLQQQEENGEAEQGEEKKQDGYDDEEEKEGRCRD